jgi:hypothetical protein
MFNLNDYEPVAARLARWLETCEDRDVQPAVITDLVHYGEGWCVFKASLYEGNTLISTGWAEEHIKDRGVNATSHVENCETSAVGRALANAGHAGSDWTKRASQEEMAKVRRATAASERSTSPSEPRNTEPNTDTAPKRSAPTEKMLKFLAVLEKRTGEVTLEAAREDFDICRQEIDRLQEL